MESIVKPKLLNEPVVLKIGKNASVVKSHYSYRLDDYYDITFKTGDNEVFIGRFLNVYDGMINAEYNDGKIMVDVKEFNDKELVITKILSLYDIVDDMFYACTENEALKQFDSNLDNKHLKNPNNMICRQDTEKRRRTIK